MTKTSHAILTVTLLVAAVVGGIHYFRDPQKMLRNAPESNLILTDVITARQIKLDEQEKEDAAELAMLPSRNAAAARQGRKDGRNAIPRFIDAIMKNLGQGRSFFPLQIPYYQDSPNQSYAEAFVQELRTGITDPRVEFSPQLVIWKDKYAVEVKVR